MLVTLFPTEQPYEQPYEQLVWGGWNTAQHGPNIPTMFHIAHTQTDGTTHA